VSLGCDFDNCIISVERAPSIKTISATTYFSFSLPMYGVGCVRYVRGAKSSLNGYTRHMLCEAAEFIGRRCFCIDFFFLNSFACCQFLWHRKDRFAFESSDVIQKIIFSFTSF